MVKKRILKTKTEADIIKDLVLESLDRDKAEEVLTIDLTGKADFAHYMIICSGRSTRHVYSIADKLLHDLRHQGYKGLNVEGKEESKWILIDALDVIIHVFLPETRQNYSIEKIWSFSDPEAL